MESVPAPAAGDPDGHRAWYSRTCARKYLRRISKKYYDDNESALTDDEIERYIDFFEDVGLYHAKKLIDLDMVDESLGDFIMDCYNDEAVRKYIYATRAEERDNSYWERFENLAKELIERREKRGGQR